jgi:AbrB family looped-hinge helix DNA binding protein
MEFMTQIGKSGRIVVPAKFRKALDLQPGDEIVLLLENGAIRLIPLRQAVTMAQETVRQYVPHGTSLVDQLLRARREEAARE